MTDTIKNILEILDSKPKVDINFSLDERLNSLVLKVKYTSEDGTKKILERCLSLFVIKNSRIPILDSILSDINRKLSK